MVDSWKAGMHSLNSRKFERSTLTFGEHRFESARTYTDPRSLSPSNRSDDVRWCAASSRPGLRCPNPVSYDIEAHTHPTTFKQARVVQFPEESILPGAILRFLSHSFHSFQRALSTCSHIQPLSFNVFVLPCRAKPNPKP